MPPVPVPAGSGTRADPSPDESGSRDGAAPRVRRLTKRWQFLACAKGRSLARGAVAIQVLARSDDRADIGVGFTATKKVGGAVVRNRAKRRMREAARLLVPLHGLAGHDYVLIARAGAPDRAWLRLLDDVKSALVGLAAGDGEAVPAFRARSARPKVVPPPTVPPPTASSRIASSRPARTARSPH